MHNSETLPIALEGFYARRARLFPSAVVWAMGIAWVWSGLVIGVSFVATPAKFLVASLDLGQALEIGRATFGVLRWVDCTLLVVLAIVVLVRPVPGVFVMTGALACIIASQYIGVLPLLDERVALIQQGIAIDPSHLHLIYIALTLTKVGLLTGIGYRCAKSLNWGSHEPVTLD